MDADAGIDGPPGVRDPATRELYATPVLLPMIVGVATCLAGVLLLDAGASRAMTLVALLDAAVGLVVGGVVLYFLLGLWLVPGSLSLSGVSFLIGFEIDSRIPSATTGAGIAWIAVGALCAVLGAFRWSRPRIGATRPPG